MADSVDFSFLHEVSDGDKEFEKELIELYLEDVVGHLQSLKKLRDDGSHDPVRQAAHSIKGSSANLGASLMKNRAEELENIARQGQGAWGTELKALEAAFATTKSEFENYLRTLNH